MRGKTIQHVKYTCNSHYGRAAQAQQAPLRTAKVRGGRLARRFCRVRTTVLVRGELLIVRVEARRAIRRSGLLVESAAIRARVKLLRVVSNTHVVGCNVLASPDNDVSGALVEAKGHVEVLRPLRELALRLCNAQQ